MFDSVDDTVLVKKVIVSVSDNAYEFIAVIKLCSLMDFSCGY